MSLSVSTCLPNAILTLALCGYQRSETPSTIDAYSIYLYMTVMILNIDVTAVVCRHFRGKNRRRKLFLTWTNNKRGLLYSLLLVSNVCSNMDCVEGRGGMQGCALSPLYGKRMSLTTERRGKCGRIYACNANLEARALSCLRIYLC